MIGYFSSSPDSAVGLDMFKTVIVSFKYMTRMMMSSGFWNSIRIYCFSFSINFLYWSLASLCSDVVPKTVPKSSTSPLKLLVGDVYNGRLNHPPLPSRPWWLPFPLWTPRPRPRPPLLELDSLISEAKVIFASLPSPPFLPAADEVVSVSGVILFYSFILFSLLILLKLHSYPRSVWAISPCVFSLWTRKWCSLII